MYPPSGPKVSPNMFWPNFLISPLKTSGTASSTPKFQADEETCLIQLDNLQLGQCGLIQQLDLSDSEDKRLRTMGICPGRRAWLVRRGDPMILKIMGTRIGLAAELAQRVTVEVCAPPYEGFQDPLPIRLEREPGEPGEPKEPRKSRESGT